MVWWIRFRLGLWKKGEGFFQQMKEKSCRHDYHTMIDLLV